MLCSKGCKPSQHFKRLVFEEERRSSPNSHGEKIEGIGSRDRLWWNAQTICLPHLKTLRTNDCFALIGKRYSSKLLDGDFSLAGLDQMPYHLFPFGTHD